MRQSNTYIILFAAGLTIVSGGLLAWAAVGLGPIQAKQIAIDTRQKILRAVMDISEIPKEDITSVYKKRITSLVVNIDGEIVKTNAEGDTVTAEEVDVAKQFKKPPEERLYPVFKFMSPNNPGKVDAYIFPVYGNGLWDNIWGYIALESDLNTIRGVVFDHAGETPGLGARITSMEIQQRYIDKTIFNEVGELVAVTMMKGETGDPSIYNEHQVDGMAGATITGNGVNNMLLSYLTYYKSYFEKVSSGAYDRVTPDKQPASASVNK